MRISDWSSDVCSSDLIGVIAIATALYFYQRGNASKNPLAGIVNVAVDIGDQRFMRWHTPRDLPAITFQDEAGKEMSLTAIRGKVVLLNIWATWCPPCREEMTSLDRLNDKRSEEHTSELQTLMRSTYDGL